MESLKPLCSSIHFIYAYLNIQISSSIAVRSLSEGRLDTYCKRDFKLFADFDAMSSPRPFTLLLLPQ